MSDYLLSYHTDIVVVLIYYRVRQYWTKTCVSVTTGRLMGQIGSFLSHLLEGVRGGVRARVIFIRRGCKWIVYFIDNKKGLVSNADKLMFGT